MTCAILSQSTGSPIEVPLTDIVTSSRITYFLRYLGFGLWIYRIVRKFGPRKTLLLRFMRDMVHARYGMD